MAGPTPAPRSTMPISAGILLTLELDRPFGGLITVSSTPLEHVYENLGH
ncbi:MAG: hypothetical protein WD711_11160 [Dongiaceae bacterium]